MSDTAASKKTFVKVYSVPVRLWHWTNALAIVVLAVTGYLIGSPPPSMDAGEAYEQFVFGYIRFIHFAAAYIMIIGWVARIYLAIIGDRHARQIFTLPILDKNWWAGVWHEIQWYAFMVREPKKYIGHNPLAQLAMFMFFTLGVTFMIFTGLALYGEGAGMGSWQEIWFGWVIPLFGQSQNVHTWHHLGMYWILVFVMIHIYVAVREDVMSRQSIVSSMISGERAFRDDLPVEDEEAS